MREGKKVDFFMPLYVGDYLADTSHMDAEQHGAYLLLLMAAWKRDGRLPNDPLQLARIACVPGRRWARVWGIIARFFRVDGQDLVQGRVVRELEKAKREHSGRVRGGLSSAETRRLNLGSAAPGFSPNLSESRGRPRAELALSSEDPHPQPDLQPDPDLGGGSGAPPRQDAPERRVGQIPGKSANAPQAATGGALRLPGRPPAVTGAGLQATFGRVRSRVVGGLPWQGVRARDGRLADMADAINEDPSSVPDVEPTMELMFRKAQGGKYNRSRDAIESAAFAFGLWCSEFTPLREELRGVRPAVPVEAERGDAAEPFAVRSERRRQDQVHERFVDDLRAEQDRTKPSDPRAEYAAELARQKVVAT